MKKAQNIISNQQLHSAAIELNQVLGLNPPIDISQTDDVVLKQLYEAAALLYLNDKLTAETHYTLKCFNIKIDPNNVNPFVDKGDEDWIRTARLKKWIYEHNDDNSARYILGTKGENPLLCFGINPSTAEPNKLDNTLKSVERISISNGFDSWIMMNIYPHRATDPKNIHRTLDFSLHKKNLEFLDRVFAGNSNSTIWAAWGTLIECRPFLINCLRDIYSLSQNHNCKWVTIGRITKKGHPHHPLYLSSTSKFEIFDINGYLEKSGIES